MKISEKRKSDYLAPHITIVRSECGTILAGSITGEGGDFEWAAKEYDSDMTEDGVYRQEGHKGDIDLWGDDF
ncbi:hypothetical protein HPS54_08155 [Prevotella sp. PCHR]|uniref:Uncharacterized protein n=1 Tax=Xylanibacter caecicola TaxID=2736294 RepID=A0ABX2B1X9_9BACT|nr:hypothetical protein [Xylanibacter caecicola]NPE25482.1 hypothetical protein [Xylanibacter caecicola]